MAKALGYYTYTGTTEVGAGETLPITNTIRQYGNCIYIVTGKQIGRAHV